MSSQKFRIFQCEEPTCRFRFPTIELNLSTIACPKCGLISSIAVSAFSNQTIPQTAIEGEQTQITGLLDNIRSAYNVGSMFRTANTAGLTHLYLCGITPTPKHPKVAKTSLGAERSVSWSHHNNALDLAAKLRDAGDYLVAIEAGTGSQWLPDYSGAGQNRETIMMVGNELSGVDPELLEMCDQALALPMLGDKTSLNVTVAFGIAAYYLRYFPVLGANHNL